MRHLILGTAGHIDHGKTTLIKKLTGTNTDRLAEEQERGISIDLGFSSLLLNEQIELGIVDVPGHEKFVKNMLAGAGGIDLALLVISAEEGVMAQTREHLNILQLLGVERGLVAVTKVDLVDREWLDLVKEDIKDNLAGTFLDQSSLVEVCSINGEGIEELLNELEALTTEVPTKDESGNLYLPLDRSFSIAGFGTVVTGTLISGSLEEGEELLIYPQQKRAIVRNIQIHEQAAPKAVAGQRVGVNLTGVEVSEINRGDILARAQTLKASTLMDVKLRLLAEAPLSLEHNDRLRVHIGAKEVLARISILDKEEIYPGEEAYVQLRLEEEVVAYYNQPYVIRRYSPMLTIGGGRVLFAQTTKHRGEREELLQKLTVQAEGSDLERVELALQEVRRVVGPGELIVNTGLTELDLKRKCKELVTQQKAVKFKLGAQVSYLHQQHYNLIKDKFLDSLKEYHQAYHLRWGRPKEEARTQLEIELAKREYNQFLGQLLAEELIEIEGDEVKLRAHQIELNSQEKELKESIESYFKQNLFTPPDFEELKSELAVKEELLRELFNLLVNENKLKRVIEEIYFHQQALVEAEQRLRNYLEQESKIELGEYRDLLDSSRKYTLALLNYFDQEGLTKRVGDERVLRG